MVRLAKMKSVDKSESKNKPEAVENPVKKTDVNTAWRTEPQHGIPTEHGALEKTALKQILTKMDAQFLEIKETLYVRIQWCGLRIDCSATFTLVTHIWYTHLRIVLLHMFHFIPFIVIIKNNLYTHLHKREY